ncbi:alpha/beta hydrolase family protein [Sphingomonas immobilis]|uniref:S9 family peptidase n=1 Tax=Sphingomonas immobilis TaxID=3063997 RepID=A0ABT8ZV25_9SPHN|nr:S9 family peptidase [Sphingomonas sp. CA1-15]MDO7841437.1 S9 family peptidase [Sphingomonas sp. CA1-15]
MSKRMIAVLLACAPAAPLHAASDAATRFGARENVGQISLSPDGKHVAVIGPTKGAGSAVFVASLETGDLKPVLTVDAALQRLTDCHWTTNTRLVCRAYTINNTSVVGLLGYTRLVAVDADGKNQQQLSLRKTDRALGFALGGGDIIDWQADSANGSVLMARAYVAETNTGSLAASTRQGYGVDRVDTVTLKRTTVEPPRDGAIAYITDGRGNVRIMETRGTDNDGYRGNTIRVLYRTKGNRDWRLLNTITISGSVSTGFEPVAIDSDRDVVYGFDSVGGFQTLVAMSLDGSMKRETVLAKPGADVDTLVQVGRQNRVVGAGFATDRRETHYFDPQFKALATALAKAIPGLPLVNIVDASADESKLLLFAGSDIDPGRYYLFDKATRHLGEVLPQRPQLAEIKLATVKPVSIPGADGTAIPAYLTLPPGSDGKGLPAIVMPHGGPDARDEWGFDWLAQFFANRGYAVLQPNFRGSTGYGSAFFKDNGFKSWPTAIGDVNDSGRWLIKQGIASSDKLAIVGWSYGGYAALQSGVVDPALFKAIVAVAPVTDLESLRGEFTDFTSFPQVDAQIGRGPHVVAGSPAQRAQRITAPVLLFHGDGDRNVSVNESRLMASRLRAANKKVELIEYHNLDHQLDDSDVRAAMLDRMDGFLRTTMGMPPAP